MHSYNISLMLRIQGIWLLSEINIVTLAPKVRKVFPISNAIRLKRHLR